MAQAMSSFPVPVSPWIKTVASVAATNSTCRGTLDNAGLSPTISEKPNTPEIMWVIGAVPRTQFRKLKVHEIERLLKNEAYPEHHSYHGGRIRYRAKSSRILSCVGQQDHHRGSWKAKIGRNGLWQPRHGVSNSRPRQSGRYSAFRCGIG
jgi:hypothetical protein